MRKLLPLLLCFGLFAASCDFINRREVSGNGKQKEETRNVSNTDKIKLEGSIDLDLVPGTTPSVKVIADENLLQYIRTERDGDYLLIKVDDEYKLRSSNPIKVEVTTDKLHKLEIAGSGDVKGKGKFSGADKLDVSMAGNSNVDLEINTPSVDIDVAGSGNVNMKGETKDLKIDIAGSGNFKGFDLMAESAKISVAGSGDVEVYADTSLDVSIMGSGDVSYKGKATIKSSIAGSGSVKKVD
ncbi:head GIN domain-containing protein [Danxiaibacter flavus]|uniref:Head GIN domain-containing protein n=1 Tax=Danxiaibacter flavus TaxID=3049108 RepID=A0ABV3ZJI5_9BACT|nr:head GIN domain-containing protein [Chitinophagaceae bacterium DXS]